MNEQSTSLANDTVQKAADVAHKTVDRVADMASSATERLSTSGNQLMDDVCAYASSRPFKALGCALVVGFVLGRLIP